MVARRLVGIAIGVLSGVTTAIVALFALALILANFVFGERGAGAFGEYVPLLLAISITCGAAAGVHSYGLVVRSGVKPDVLSSHQNLFPN